MNPQRSNQRSHVSDFITLIHQCFQVRNMTCEPRYQTRGHVYFFPAIIDVGKLTPTNTTSLVMEYSYMWKIKFIWQEFKVLSHQRGGLKIHEAGTSTCNN